MSEGAMFAASWGDGSLSGQKCPLNVFVVCPPNRPPPDRQRNTLETNKPKHINVSPMRSDFLPAFVTEINVVPINVLIEELLVLRRNLTKISHRNLSSGRVAVCHLYHARHVVKFKFQFAVHRSHVAFYTAVEFQRVLCVLLLKRKRRKWKKVVCRQQDKQRNWNQLSSGEKILEDVGSFQETFEWNDDLEVLEPFFGLHSQISGLSYSLLGRVRIERPWVLLIRLTLLHHSPNEFIFSEEFLHSGDAYPETAFPQKIKRRIMNYNDPSEKDIGNH